MMRASDGEPLDESDRHAGKKGTAMITRQTRGIAGDQGPGRAALLVLLVLVVSLSGAAGCAVATIDTMKNQAYDPKEPQYTTRASEQLTTGDLADGVFVGIALSGGGSRAANFSAAVLLELEALGILDKATAISSVSGSSLPAAYYGLNGAGKNPLRWNSVQVQKELRKDFEERWMWSWLLPQNIAAYWFTNFNRSDIMKEVLDSNLFGGQTFAAMGQGRPRILINATTLSEGKRFVFSKEQFRGLASRIDTYPVANAAMASSAFPGAFHDMTLRDFSVVGQGKNYEHVLDGGPSDNLGTTTLLTMVTDLYKRPDQPKGCFLFVVDAYPYPQRPAHVHEADTRNFIDFFFDTNVAASSDALLAARRIDLMNQLNVDVRGLDIVPFQTNTGDDRIWPDPDPYDDLRVECAVWHLSLQRLLAPDFASRVSKDDDYLKRHIKEVAEVVNSIPTRYKLTGKDPNSDKELGSEALQDYLFKAAEYLLYLDNDENGVPLLARMCDWFESKGMKGLKCRT